MIKVGGRLSEPKRESHEENEMYHLLIVELSETVNGIWWRYVGIIYSFALPVYMFKIMYALRQTESYELYEVKVEWYFSFGVI